MPWLLKAEPNSRIVKGKDVKYTIDDLQKEGVASWDGVRNNEARKYLAAMRLGDMAFFYRSNCSEPGIVGTMKIVREAHPDKTAADPSEPYYDARSPEGKWIVVDLEYVSHIDPPILLSRIKANPKLQNMFLVKRSRLSVSPVTDDEWQEIMHMKESAAEPDSNPDRSTGKSAKRRNNGKDNRPDLSSHLSDSSGKKKEEEISSPPRKKSRRRH